MREFHDSQGRAFPIAIHIGTVKRVLKQTGINLLNVDQRIEISKGQPIPLGLVLHGADVMRLAEVVYAACQPMLTEKGITEEEFYVLLDGKTLGSAQAAFLAEWEEFFQKMGRTESIQLLHASREMFQAAVQRVKSMVADAERSVMDVLQADLQKPAE